MPTLEQQIQNTIFKVERLEAEVERLQEALQVQTEGIWEIIADWANDEGIGFDQTARLSKALERKQEPREKEA